MASASEATSCYFVANLGNLDSAVVERLEKWAGETRALNTVEKK